MSFANASNKLTLVSFVVILVVSFVGGMLYYSMNVLWPRQAAQLFVPASNVMERGGHAVIFAWGGIREFSSQSRFTTHTKTI